MNIATAPMRALVASAALTVLTSVAAAAEEDAAPGAFHRDDPVEALDILGRARLPRHGWRRY